MEFRKIVMTLGLAASGALLAACATAPATPAAPAQAAAPGPAAAATAEADTAAGLEKKFQDAARSFKVVQRDGKTLYCKREKVMGSTIPTLQCITEAQLRIQVENTDELRQRMRNRAGGCVQTGGCSGGG
jgi:phosphate-selective porin